MSTNKQSRGAFIVFEGPDRSGKSTQAAILVQNLNQLNIRAELFNFPNRTTPSGVQLDAYLTKKLQLEPQQAHELFAKNRQESMDIFETKLQSGVTLVVDRYSYSGVVFTAAKELPTLDVTWGLDTESKCHLIAPDLVLYFNLSEQEQQRRAGFGNERYENVDFQRHARQKYELLEQMSPRLEQLIPNLHDDVPSFIPNVSAYQQYAISSSKIDTEITSNQTNSPNNDLSNLVKDLDITTWVTPWTNIAADNRKEVVSQEVLRICQIIVQTVPQLPLHWLPPASSYLSVSPSVTS